MAGEEVEGEEEDEEEDEKDQEEADEGQQREQHAQASGASFEGRAKAGADTMAPPRRARPPPGSYADTGVDYDEEEDEGDEDEEEWGGDEEDEDEEEAEPCDQRAQESSASIKGGGVAVHPLRLTPGARFDPESPRARLWAPGMVADSVVQDHDVDGEEAGVMPELRKREGGGHAGSSRFAGVIWDKCKKKWKVRCKGKSVGYHTTEEVAARVYSKYLKDGIDHVKHREATYTSQVTGVSWSKRTNKWKAECAGAYLGLHTTEEAAAHAYSKYVEDGSVPGPAARAEWCTSQFKGVSWNTGKNKWVAQCKMKHLGYHITEEAAARACNKYLEDGIDPVKHRDATNTSKFTGVSWNTHSSNWQAKCKGTYLGLHATENAAARAYNVEAERLGIALNIVPPAGAAGDGGDGAGAGPKHAGGAGTGAGTGRKRAAPKPSAAPAPSKKPKL